MIRILLVDDHNLVRIGLHRLLDEQRGMHVVGEAESGEAALQKARDLQPDVVLMDVNMPGMGGVEATRRLLSQNADLRVVAITAHSDAVVPKRLLEMGAQAYVTKDAPVEELVLAIKKASAGQAYISQNIAQKMALQSLPSTHRCEDPFAQLSQREMQVLMMLVEGQSNQAISHSLCLSPKTVSTYRSRLLTKLGLDNEIALLKLAMKHGIVDDVYAT